MNRKKGPPPDGKGLKRTFPKKGKPGSGGPPAKKKKMEEMPIANVSLSEMHEKEGWKETDELRNEQNISTLVVWPTDSTLSRAMANAGYEETEELRRTVYCNSLILLHSIAEHLNTKVVLAMSKEKSGCIAHVRLAITKFDGKNNFTTDDHRLATVLASYTYFKRIIFTGGLISSFSLFIHLLIQLSSESLRSEVAKTISPLILSLVSFNSDCEGIKKKYLEQDEAYPAFVRLRKKATTTLRKLLRCARKEKKYGDVEDESDESEVTDEKADASGQGKNDWEEEMTSMVEKDTVLWSMDGLMSHAMAKGGYEETEELRRRVYCNSWIVLQAIATNLKSKLVWKIEKNGLTYDAWVRLGLSTMPSRITSFSRDMSVAKSMACHAYFKDLMNSRGLFPDFELFNKILIEFSSIQSEVTTMMTQLVKIFFTVNHQHMGRKRGMKEEAYPEFIRTKAKIAIVFQKLWEKTKKKVDDGEDGMMIDERVEEGEATKQEDDAVSQKIKTEVKEETEKYAGKVKKERPEGVDEFGEKKMQEDSQRSMKEEREDDECRPSTSFDPPESELRCNLIDLATSEWVKNVNEYGIQNVPSKKDRFAMSRKILVALEAEYGEKLSETLKYYTLHEFSADILKKRDEAIGLLMYLDVKKFVGTSFFFLLLATNDMSTTERAIPLIAPLCHSQFNFIKIDKSRSLGRNLEVEWKASSADVVERRRELHLCYPLLFSSVLMGRKFSFGDGDEVNEKREGGESNELPFVMKKIKREKLDDVKENEDFCEVITVPKKKVKVEVISDEDEEGNRKKKKKEKIIESTVVKKESEREGNKAIKVERDAEASTSTPIWNKMFMNVQGEEDRASSRGDSREDDDCKLITFRARLVELSTEYWESVCITTRIKSSLNIEKKYTIARVIIRFLEEKFGEDFHQMLFTQTTIKFTPSDLQEREEVIGFVMWLDRLRLPTGTFFVHLIALNRESECERLLTEAIPCITLRLELSQLNHRYALGESVRTEQMSVEEKFENATKVLFAHFGTFFADVTKKTKEDEMKSCLYTDGYWMKYSRHFNIKSEWTYFDVTENALVIFRRLYPLAKGFMKFSNKDASKPGSEVFINMTPTKALSILMKMNVLFPEGFLFLLLRNKNVKVMDRLCKLLTSIAPMYEKFVRDKGVDVVAWRKNKQSRLETMRANSNARKCVEILKKHLQNSTEAESGTNSLPPMSFHGNLPPDEVLWKCEKTWKVWTIWSRPKSMEDWEEEHSEEMEEFNQRVDRFFFAAVIRVEHYTAKLNAFNAIKSGMRKELKKWKATMSMAGSTPTSLSSNKSNLDIAFTTKKHVDRAELVNYFKNEGKITKDDGVGSFTVVMENRKTANIQMVITVHIDPSIPFMTSVYQMADKQDERVGKMAIVLKAWRICDPSCKSAKLKSYHLMSLLIHYLQCGVSPPVLPGLSHSRDKIIPPENTQSVASLLLGFFTYFADFEFENYVISIKTGSLIKRSSLELTTDLTLFIENPYRDVKDETIKSDVNSNVMRAACRRAKKTVETEFKIPYIEQI